MVVRSERGLTLTELTVVMVLATLVMVGLMTFYFSSQATWMDGSTQAVTQREATLVIKEIASQVHRSAKAEVQTDAADPAHDELILKDRLDNELCRFTYMVGDSLLHKRIGPVGGPTAVDKGPVAISKLERFNLVSIGDSLLDIQMIQLKSASGQHVRIASTVALYNNPTP
jgi:hypothetical protein